MPIYQNNQNKPSALGSVTDTSRAGSGTYQDSGNINGNPQGTGTADQRYALGSGWNTANVANHNATNDFVTSGGSSAITAAQNGGTTDPSKRLTLSPNWANANVVNHNGTNEVRGALSSLADNLSTRPDATNPNNPTNYTGGYYGGAEAPAAPAVPNAPGYTAPTLPTAVSQEAYINAMYDANRQAQESALRNAYEQQVNVLNDQASRLPAAYDAAADQVAAQAAIQQRNFNEQAAASGLNTGAGSQARLAQNNAYLGNIRQVRQAQADAQAKLELQRAQLEAQYRNAIADAINQNDLQRAQALYQEAVRVDNSLTDTAIQQAGLDWNEANLNWNTWNALYNQ